jgi:hypothetical protein
MKEVTKEILKDNLVRVNETIQKAKEKVEIPFMKKLMIKIYLKSPAKVQYALAKMGVKNVIEKKKTAFKEMLKK